MKKILLLTFLFLSVAIIAQDDEDSGTKKFCNEIDNKTALKLFEKATDKKKYKKPERLDFLKKCLEARSEERRVGKECA